MTAHETKKNYETGAQTEKTEKLLNAQSNCKSTERKMLNCIGIIYGTCIEYPTTVDIYVFTV